MENLKKIVETGFEEIEFEFVISMGNALNFEVRENMKDVSADTYDRLNTKLHSNRSTGVGARQCDGRR